MRTIAIINQKGGCGKTTTAINLSAVLAKLGRRTLLVDMDPQSHCAVGLGVPEQRIEMDIGDAMLAVGARPLDPPRLLWRAVRNLDLAPSRMKLAGLEAARGGLASLPDKDKRLLAVLRRLQGEYDVACIDCPPSIGLLTYNALTAADMVLIPVETSFFSLQGAMRQVNTVRTLARRFGVQLPVWLLPTIHDDSNSVASDLLDELNRRFKDQVIPVVIRRDSKLREAVSFGQTILDYAPQCSAAEDYTKLGAWVNEHLQHRALIDDYLGDQAATHEEALYGTHQTEEPEDDDLPAEFREDAPAHARTASSAAHPAATPPVDTSPTPELKPEVKAVSRAEDVARRAQDFLRRIATGRAPAAAPAPESESTADSAAPLRRSDLAPSNPLRLDVPRPVSISPSTQRLLGVRETNQGVLFVLPMSLGSSIAIASDFNNWSSESHRMKANEQLGVFELCVKLPPGKVRYRLLIDGHWSTDPYNDLCEPNPFGETNSYFVVSTPYASANPTPTEITRTNTPAEQTA